MNAERLPGFLEFLQETVGRGRMANDDLLAAVLPLMRQVLEIHQQGLVAPLDGVDDINVQNGKLWFERGKTTEPEVQMDAVRRLQGDAGEGAVCVVADHRVDRDIDDGSAEYAPPNVQRTTETIEKLVYVPYYTSWEFAIGHHDQLTDIFALGLLSASLALGLDFTECEDLETFVRSRGNLFHLNPDLHPVIASVLLSMTELNRHRRAQDLASAVSCLESYRDQPTNRYQPDYTELKGFREATATGRQEIILTHLRDRLFEISRRNRVLYFRRTMQTLDLTEASIPILLDYHNIREDQLCYWHSGFAGKVIAGKTLNLGSYLNFKDLPYITGILDRIRRDAARHQKEYGFAPLRLVIAFLRWHNLKEFPEERIHTPLLLLPAELTRKKGVRDTYLLKPLSTEAEVNPVLRHHLKQLYDLDLPQAIDLSEMDVTQFHEYLRDQIHASERGVKLQLIDRPQIELIYENAKHRLNQFRRRQRVSGRGVRKYDDDIDYCYGRSHYHPLGLQLFLHKVRPAPTPFDNLLNEKPTFRYPFATESSGLQSQSSITGMRRRTLYALRRGSETNPYVWDFDLCSTTLGNFNYRKMSLVQDYASILENHTQDRAFDEIFSTAPRDLEILKPEPMDPDDLNLIVPADPTQASSVTHSREGPSYIIQGPPGTGKSQTITNLIADFVAREKRVLFVCEKRAAIDVVFHRLQQQGLDRLACLIHDSQSDKKEFIQELKETYEFFAQEDDRTETIEKERQSVRHTIREEMTLIQMYAAAMCTEYEGAGIELRHLIRRLVELRASTPELSPAALEQLPGYDQWIAHSDAVLRLTDCLQEVGKTPVLAQHAVRLLNRRTLDHDEPIGFLESHLDNAGDALDRLTEGLDESELDTDQWDDLGQLQRLRAYTELMTPFAEHDLIQLLHEGSAEALKYEELQARLKHAEDELAAAREKNCNWNENLPERDAQTALELARQLEGRFLSIFRPSWWRLRRVLRTHYQFDRCVVKPTWVQILTELLQEYEVAARDAEARDALSSYFHVEDADWLRQLLKTTRAAIAELPDDITEYHLETLIDDDPVSRIHGLQRIGKSSTELKEILDDFLIDYEDLDLQDLEESFGELRQDLPDLPELIPSLCELADLPEKLQQAVRTLPLPPDGIEAALATKSYRQALTETRFLTRFDSRSLQRHIERIEKAYNRLLAVNAKAVVSKVHKAFREKLWLCNLPAAQLTPDQKDFKKSYNAGRRELEHEFGKVMRYKSLRDLGTGDSGMVIRDIKPVWLMSPLSVADTLPLISDYFDVVIFDEASQVKMEEAVPAIFRATQAIVVGDEMQLPPTTFFTAQRNDDDTVVVEDETGEDIVFDLNFESLLTQSARNLPSILLGWHYRSRYEALIGFSNATFYRNQLLTIPDHQLPPQELDEIRVEETPAGAGMTDEIMQRSISFHYLEHGIYEKRRNATEAAYIAEVVRALLRDDSRQTIGIVAFSEAQQDEIENALERLAADDDTFRRQLDDEVEREDDGQFCGLFVKNLENVQGDERDIIILSICYGYDRKHYMRMNFGPINKTGGEKRLNVIFSRAKHHMVVVSSIRHGDITNDYNDGARCLKNFLEYAAAISCSDEDTAARVLRGIHGREEHEDGAGNAIVREVQAELERLGYHVSRDVGRSKFRCSLAVRRPDQLDFELGVLVDTDAHYAVSDLFQRYYIQPVVLRIFGWRTAFVLSNDWLQNRDDVLRRLERLLAGHEEDLSTENPAELPSGFQQVIAAETRAAAAAAAEKQDENEFCRYVELHTGSHGKFWEVQVRDCTYTVRFGRIGTEGQTMAKDFATPERARYEGERMLKKKLDRGYQPPSS